jgi:hypothetical protein
VPFLTVVPISSSAKQSEARSVMALAGHRRERVVALPCCCDDEGRAARKFTSASKQIAKQTRAFFPGKLSCIEEDFSGNIFWTLDIARGRDRGGSFGGEAMSRNYWRQQEEEEEEEE